MRRKRKRKKWEAEQRDGHFLSAAKDLQTGNSDPKGHVRAVGSWEAWQDPFFSFPVTSNIIWLIFLEIFLAVPLNPECFPSSLKCTSENYSSVWRLDRAGNAVRSKRIELHNQTDPLWERESFASNIPVGQVLKASEGRWRVAGPLRGGETGALSRCLSGHTSIKASDTELDAATQLVTWGLQRWLRVCKNQKQWRESRRKDASSLTTRTGLGCSGSGHWMVSQNLGTSVPVSARIKDVMIWLSRLLFMKEDLQIFL